MENNNIDNIFREGLQGHSSQLDTDAFYARLNAEAGGSPWWSRLAILAFLFLVTCVGIWAFSAKVSTSQQLGQADISVDGNTSSVSSDELLAYSSEMSAQPTASKTETASNDLLAFDQTVGLLDKNIAERSSSANATGLNRKATENTASKNSKSTERQTQKYGIPPLVENNTAVAADKLSRTEATAVNELPGSSHSIGKPAIALPDMPLLPSETAVNLRSSDIEFGIDIQGSYGWTTRKLGLQDNSANELFALRQGSEEMMETVSLSVMGRATLESGLYARLGAGYTRITERFDAEGTTTSFDTINTITEVIIDPMGDTSFIRGDAPVTTTTSFRKRVHNYHSLIDVPVIIGYTIGDGISPLSLQIEGGAILNLSMSSTGEIYDEQSNLIKVEDEEIFRKSVGISYYGGLHIRYAFSENLSLYAGPYYRYFPKSFTEDEYALSQKYQTLGLNLGVQIGL